MDSPPDFAVISPGSGLAWDADVLFSPPGSWIVWSMRGWYDILIP